MTEDKLRRLLMDMSLEEKVGQLVQISGSYFKNSAVVTGTLHDSEKMRAAKKLCGSTLGVYGAELICEIQKRYMEEQPHHIPLLFMMDVIHGFRTIFPCPLGQGASFCTELVEECAGIAAAEASASGVHVTFAPMADLVRDARWGRVMEATGEDPWLNGELAAAAVAGFQGQDPGERGRVAACVKHFAAYGAATAGRDYQNAELSEHTLRDFYLPAYEKAVKAGCAMVMTAFQTWNGIPCTANPWLIKKILREEMGFEGVVISDWGAVGELMRHGLCEDAGEASRQAFEAGTEIDMCANAYAEHLTELVREGSVSEGALDDAVWHVLELKNRLGLFENPYKDADPQTERMLCACARHRQAARRAVASCAVLLKNEGTETGEALLPLAAGQRLAFIGPYVDGESQSSTWAVTERVADEVSVKMAAQERYAPESLTFAAGCTLYDNHTLLKTGEYAREDWEVENERLLSQACEAAAWADTVVLCLGEGKAQTGEAASRSRLTLPGVQLKLLRTLQKINPNIVTVIYGGRPLVLSEVVQRSRAVLMAWLPGTEGGHGILDVLTGAAEPGGRLPMCIPYEVGQLPMSYDVYSTGRPFLNGQRREYTSSYLDVPNEPLFPFGFGLTYTEFQVSEVTVTKAPDGTCLEASATWTNTGSRTGTQTVQLYIQDVAASRVRPVRQLKGVQRITLLPGESRRTTFLIDGDMLSFYRADGTYGMEHGRFRVWITDSSAGGEPAEFVW